MNEYVFYIDGTKWRVSIVWNQQTLHWHSAPQPALYAWVSQLTRDQGGALCWKDNPGWDVFISRGYRSDYTHVRTIAILSVLSSLGSFTFLYCISKSSSLRQHVWSWKRRKGARKGRRKTSPQGATRQHPGYYQACNPTTCQARWGQENLRSHIRRNTRSPEGVPRECHPWCSNLLRARQTQDRHRHGCRVRIEEAGPHSVRFRRLGKRTSQPQSTALFRATTFSRKKQSL